MEYLTSVLDELKAIEENNVTMRKIYNQQINENKRADGESKPNILKVTSSRF